MKKKRGRTSPSPKPSTELEVRASWRSCLDAEFPYGENFWRETDNWDRTWDHVAAMFREHVPIGVREARDLEAVVANLRRRVELAFVEGKPIDGSEAHHIIARIARQADLAFGLPKSRAKLRRYRLMCFIDECVRSGLATWPDFDALAKAWRGKGGSLNPDVGAVPMERPSRAPNISGRWLRLVDLGRLRELLDAVGDVSSIPPHVRDQLVAAWRARAPGAKKTVGGSGTNVGAYALLSRTLQASFNDKTGAMQLKREWSQLNPWRPRKARKGYR